jgi:hypothetical protein
VTQVAQTIYPRLKSGGTNVTYRAGSRAVAPVLPTFATDEATLAPVEAREFRSPNVTYAPRTAKSRLAYQLRGNQPGTVAWRVQSPTELLEVSAAARFTLRVPPPEKCDFHLEISTDDGKSWRPLGRADIPRDNEYSSGWMYGSANVVGDHSNQALIRAHFFAGGTQTGLITFETYGTHRTAPPQHAIVTVAWKESGTVKTHTEQIPAGQSEHTFQVATGQSIVDEYLRIEVP